MKLISNQVCVTGYLKYGHKVMIVPKDMEEEISKMNENELKDFLNDEGDWVLDDYELEDGDYIESVEICK